MKVKIMDYETAKAEVLAREQKPRLANDKTVWVLIILGLDGDKLEMFINTLMVSVMWKMAMICPFI